MSGCESAELSGFAAHGVVGHYFFAMRLWGHFSPHCIVKFGILYVGFSCRDRVDIGATAGVDTSNEQNSQREFEMVLSKTLLTLTAPVLGVALLVSAPASAQNTSNPSGPKIDGNLTGPTSGPPQATLTGRPSTKGFTAGVSQDASKVGSLGNLVANPK
jgi:hypothetical protein